MHILISTQCSFGILHKLEVSKNKALALSQEAWCHVYGLLQGASLGYELLAHVFAHLDILETDYFGLQYTDEKSVTRWIDQDKSIKKQTCKQRGGSLHVCIFLNGPVLVSRPMLCKWVKSSKDVRCILVHFHIYYLP